MLYSIKQVGFTCFLKVPFDWTEWSWLDKSFQALSPANENARSINTLFNTLFVVVSASNIELLMQTATTRRCWNRMQSVSETLCRVCETRRSTSSVRQVHQETQLEPEVREPLELWSCHLRLSTRRAAAFCTRYNVAINDCSNPAKRQLQQSSLDRINAEVNCIIILWLTKRLYLSLYYLTCIHKF